MDPEYESRWPEAEDGVFGELTVRAMQRFFRASYEEEVWRKEREEAFEKARAQAHFWIDANGNVHQNFEEPVLTEGIKDWMRLHQPDPIPDDVLKSIDDAFHWDGK